MLKKMLFELNKVGNSTAKIEIAKFVGSTCFLEGRKAIGTEAGTRLLQPAQYKASSYSSMQSKTIKRNIYSWKLNRGSPFI